MKWFKNWKTFYKINALVLVMVVFMLGLSFMGYYYYRQAKVAMNDIYSNSLISVKLINEANANVRMIRSVNAELLLAPLDSSQKQNLLIQTTVLQGLINESLDNYTPHAIEPFEVAKLTKVREGLQKYSTEWQQVVLLIDSNDKDAAYTYFSVNVTKILEEINTLLPELVDFSAQKAQSTIARENLNFIRAEKVLFTFPLAAAVLAVTIGALVARAISKPLQIMLANVRELAAGNLTVTRINTESKDEAGQLAQAFNQMTISLSTLVRRVSKSSEQVTSSANQLLTITEQGSKASGQISQSVSEVACGTERQAGAVSETVAALEQINANIQIVAEAGQRVTALTTKTAIATKDGQMALTQAVKQMDNVSEGTQVVKNAITLLADSSEQIANIAHLITSITEQTNLLALNAAIEAARAGEHGRGFSVVAEEVRKLAEKAKAATGQISDLVVVNRENISHATVAMNAEEIYVNDGIEAVNKVGYGLNDILKMVDEVSEQIGGVSSSIQQMAAGSQQIVSGVQDIGTVSQSTAGQAANVSSAIDEFTASIDEINLSCHSLSNFAQDLQNGVSKFRI
ncbi:methyl-accepting chemotaxis protein [Desulfosporosinus sp.]|uniref:methyl-accepting chemotaxis protein n=1 Tax=Desulfosporosinus sp. TaxID=157907 RepID=UPI002315B1AC|nr:methyl-accepting chemotaxis protein [Desulfosporosinus sp.]MCO5386651.1 methyl-accepting chemotaxis protein [Desulfosporosinus sp.]MDA8222700.1 methyl-accepting chemotaxis protein [Desulfitobacterium hafniense]